MAERKYAEDALERELTAAVVIDQVYREQERTGFLEAQPGRQAIYQAWFLVREARRGNGERSTANQVPCANGASTFTCTLIGLAVGPGLLFGFHALHAMAGCMKEVGCPQLTPHTLRGIAPVNAIDAILLDTECL
jgi:hypothetical protein